MGSVIENKTIKENNWQALKSCFYYKNAEQFFYWLDHVQIKSKMLHGELNFVDYLDQLNLELPKKNKVSSDVQVMCIH